jgi:lipopolysaccharide transport system ATP-binding protein
MGDLAIRVSGLGKQYRLGAQQERYATLRDQVRKWASTPLRTLLRRAKRNERRPPFWALKDVSFEVNRGEVVGVIGRNGAGKSTLLKVLSRITEPTEGEADIHGRVGSLLEVGTGFHPELTGRENVYLNGAILGMRRSEIGRKFDEIVAFAEVETFIDTPVKHYSSGMYTRLAFAVAAHLEPEILIVDEVLAVGDVQFQKKCLGKMGEVARGGRTVLFVSHNMGAVSNLTSKCVFLEQGNVRAVGPTAEVIQNYMEAGFTSSARWKAPQRHDGDIQILAAEIRSAGGEATTELVLQRDIEIVIEYEVRRPVIGAVVAVIIHAADGALLFSTEDTDGHPELIHERNQGHYTAVVTITRGLLNLGEYYIRVGAGIPARQVQFDNHEVLWFSTVDTGDHTIRSHRRRAYFMPDLPPWKVASVDRPAAVGGRP